MSPYRGGVLIVGSLLWHPSPYRINWRTTRLDMDPNHAQKVLAPIRYGRASKNWAYTYTMVFSNFCYRNNYGLGTAIVIPFLKPVHSLNNLIEEAAELWRAELDIAQNRKLSISSDWGAVGLLPRPDAHIPDEIIRGWSVYFRDHNRLELVQPKTEKPVIDQNGLLNLRWLKNAENNSPLDLDLILATATVPTLINGKYPPVRTIAEKWNKDTKDNVRYFRNNLASGIITFQDERINPFLKKQEQ